MDPNDEGTVIAAPSPLDQVGPPTNPTVGLPLAFKAAPQLQLASVPIFRVVLSVVITSTYGAPAAIVSVLLQGIEIQPVAFKFGEPPETAAVDELTFAPPA
jgi:hypothetical protein